MRLLFLFCLLVPALSFNLKEARKDPYVILKHANTLKSSMKMKFIASTIPRLLSWHGIKNNLKHSDYMKYGDEYLSNLHGKYKSLHSIIKKGNMKEIRITERSDDHLKGIIHTKHKQHVFSCTRAGCDIHTKRLKAVVASWSYQTNSTEFTNTNSTEFTNTNSTEYTDSATSISHSVITIILGFILSSSLI
jgi:hypothetical protein